MYKTLLPFADFVQCAKSCHTTTQQPKESLILLKSLAAFFPPAKRTGVSGYAEHAYGKLWRGHELALAKHALAFAEESFNRVSLSDSERYLAWKERVLKWRDLVEYMEELGFKYSLPSLIGDEDFHSAYRAWMLFKDIQRETYKKWKHGGYADHASTRALLPKKTQWKRDHYLAIWEHFGRPPLSDWYQTQAWEEEPDDTKLFLSEDREPFINWLTAYKKKYPISPYFSPKKTYEDVDNR
jgi:hypothetical protein